MGLQARVQFNLANVYLQAGNCACSCKHGPCWIKGWPGWPVQAKQYDLALETYQRSINIDPTVIRSNLERGVLFGELQLRFGESNS